ncbi:MAG: hypothetical protein IKV77_04515 [Alistipes sp.]|nr:hypothetical protein [Alistipes sp.]
METKTYVFDGNNGSSNNQQFDPNLLWAMMFGGGGFGGYGGGNWIWPLFLLALWGGNGFGGFGGGNGLFGGRGTAFLSDQINNNYGRDLLAQLINGNKEAIGQLSTQLGCKAGDIQNALNALQSQICQFSNQTGIGQQQIINALERGDANLASQLAACCCDIKGAIKDVAIGQERGFASVAYETQRQTCDIEKAIASSTSQILEGQRAAEMREMQDKLDALREKNAQQAVILNNAQQTSQFAAMLAPIQADLAELKCNQVPVKKIACPEQYVPVNTGINATYGLIPTYCGGGFFGNGWSGWNNGSLWG